MKDGQSAIYYVTADTPAAAAASPHLEVFRKKGVEVLLLSDRVDEWMLSYLSEFEGKKLESVAKGSLDLGSLEDEAEKEQAKKVAEDFKPLTEKFKSVLGDKVKEVRMTLRLTDSPACLVADEHGLSQHLQRMLKAAGQAVPVAAPILELNPEHPLVARLKASDDVWTSEWAQLLFDQAQLAEGAQLADPADFVKRMNTLLLKQAAN